MLKGYTKGIDDLTDKVMRFFGLTEDGTGKLSWSFKDMDDKAKALAVALGGIAAIKLGGWAIGVGSNIKKVISFFGSLGTGIMKNTGLFGKLTNAVTKLFTGTSLKNYIVDWKLGIAGLKDGALSFGTVVKTLATPIARFSSAIGGVILAIKGFKTTSNVFNSTVRSVAKGQTSLNTAIGEGLKGFAAFSAAGALIGTAIAPGIGTAIGTIIGAVVGVGDAFVQRSKLIKTVAMENIYGTLQLTEAKLDVVHDKIIGNVDKQLSAIKNFSKTTKSSAKEFYESMEGLDDVIYKYETLGTAITGVGNEELLNSITQTSNKAIKLVRDSTSDTTNILTSWFKDTTSLTAEEQRDILTKVQQGGRTREEKIDDIEKEIYTIYENGVGERGYLNEEELQAIREHYQKIAELTSSELKYAGLDLNRILADVTNTSERLTADSAERLNQEIQSSTKEVNTKIQELYNQRIEVAKSTAQQLYDTAIASGEDELTAREIYNSAYSRLAQAAYDDRKTQLANATQTESQIRNAFYGKLLKSYGEYASMEESSMSEVDKKTKQMLKDLLTEAGYTQTQLAGISFATGKGMADNFLRGYGNPQLPSLTSSYNVSVLSQEAYNAGRLAGQNMSRGLADHVQLPSISYTLTTGGTNLNSLQLQPNIRGFATGGYPASGEMFMARENGIPELIGRIGNRTAVANNEQIIEGIKQGVYEGVSSANESSSSTPIYNVVNIGNRQVYRGVGTSIRNENNRYGRNVVTV